MAGAGDGRSALGASSLHVRLTACHRLSSYAQLLRDAHEQPQVAVQLAAVLLLQREDDLQREVVLALRVVLGHLHGAL